MAIVTNYIEDGVDIGDEFASAFDKVASNPEKFPGWFIDTIYDGGLWAFGLNSRGQLGDGTTTHKSSPIQVGSLTNWKQVAAGHQHTTVIK